MQQQLRHQYLEAMGITSWLPRCELAGAAPSADWVKDFRYPGPDIPFTSAAPSQQPAQAKTSAPDQAGAKAALAALGAAIESPTAQHKSTPEPEAADPVTEAETTSPDTATDITPTFKLAFFRVGECLVVDSLPPQGSVFSATYQHLATSIVASLGLKGPVSEPDLMPWPMFASKTLDQRWPEAAKSVAYKLQKELRSPTRAVLLCGEAAAQMVLQRHESLESLQGIAFTLPTGAKSVCGMSLSELMHIPGAKKAFWQHLQPLRQALIAHG